MPDGEGPRRSSYQRVQGADTSFQVDALVEELQQTKRRLSMELVTSKELQNRLAGKNEEISQMKASFKV